MKIMTYFGLATLAISAPAHAQAEAPERLYTPEAPGFVVGFHAERNGASIVERVPQGESVEAWSRMITTQSFPQKPDLRKFLAVFAEGWRNACPRSAVEPPLFTQSAGGIQEGTLHASCAFNPQTGKPEFIRVRAFATATYLHVAQFAWRRAPTKAEDEGASSFLAKAAICAAGKAKCP